eukprot:593763-Hanusia_phi.AAC.1
MMLVADDDPAGSDAGDDDDGRAAGGVSSSVAGSVGGDCPILQAPAVSLSSVALSSSAGTMLTFRRHWVSSPYGRSLLRD